MPNTDQAWQRWAKEDAYYGVMSDDKYRRDNLSKDLKREFLESGDIWILHVLATIATQLRPGFKPSSALDFGLGSMYRCSMAWYN